MVWPSRTAAVKDGPGAARGACPCRLDGGDAPPRGRIGFDCRCRPPHDTLYKIAISAVTETIPVVFAALNWLRSAKMRECQLTDE
jgi:hypothetical protein